MAASKDYNRVNWAAYPSLSTPLTANNLNKMDEGIENLDDRVVGLLNRMDTVETNISSQGSAITSLQNELTTVLTETLETGQTTLTFTDDSILSTSMLDLYAEDVIISPTEVTTDTGTVTYTFDEQESDIDFKLHVINL